MRQGGRRRISNRTRQRNRRDEQARALAKTAERLARGTPAPVIPDHLERERRAQEQFARAMMRREGVS